ncbi:MAG: DUF4097 family beta strand repeat-containing protein [Haloferacaceae archaeon]
MSQNTDSPPAERSRTRRAVLGAVAAAGTTGLAGCTGSFIEIETAETTVERRVDRAAVDRLRVTDAGGDVRIERADGDAVRVRAHKTARGETELSELEVRSRVESGTLRLSTRQPDVTGIGGGTVDLEVGVPESVATERVETDGEVVVRNTVGDVTAETGDGDVTATGVRGDVTAETSDGSVSVERADGVVAARSQDGDVSVDDPGSVDTVRTDDGAVTADVPAVDGTATVQSTDGDVTVTLGDAVDAVVEATTADGQVTAVDALDDVRTATETRVAGTVGDGTNQLTVRTADGDVTVERA